MPCRWRSIVVSWIEMIARNPVGASETNTTWSWFENDSAEKSVMVESI